MFSRLYYSMALLLTLCMLAACDSPGGGGCGTNDPDCDSPPVNVVLVYGLEGCSACSSLTSGLAANDIGFTFLDINDQVYYQELYEKMSAAHPERQVAVPVVDVNGVILPDPTVLQVKKYLWENQGSEQ